MKLAPMIGLLLLTACKTQPIQIQLNTPTAIEQLHDNGWIAYWTDPETGCQYLANMHGNMTPRMTSTPSGISVQICSKPSQ